MYYAVHMTSTPHRLQIVGNDARRAFNDFGAWTLGVIVCRARFRLAAHRGIALEPQHVGTRDGTVLGLELGRQFLHNGIVLAFRGAVFSLQRGRLQSGQHEHPAGRPAREPHAADAPAERGGHVQGLLARETVNVGKGGHHRL